MKSAKKLIEVALPLEAINKASAREKSIRHGHPSTLHLWWARRPLAAARAVIFAQMVDDPSARPDLFPTERKQEKERQRLFRIIEDLVQWENTTNEKVLQAARNEIWESWRRACAENADHPRAKELFNRNKLPAFHDPFAGGGALPLEAQRLGLEAYASDLNPVAVLINKAMIEIPPKFAGKPPVNPDAQKNKDLVGRTWRGAQGLAEDVRYYGKWMRDEAEKRIGKWYPKIEITPELSKDRKELKPLIGQKLTVVAWLWARTVKSPNPAFVNVDVPLASTFILSTKSGREAYIEPIVEGHEYKFLVRTGKSRSPDITKRGTRVGGKGSSFLCLMSGTPMEFEYLRVEAKAGRMGAKLMAIVADTGRERIYLSPSREHEAVARKAMPVDVPDTDLPEKALGFRIQEYGMTKWSHLFTPRQLLALTTFTGLVSEAITRIRADSNKAGLADDKVALRDGGAGAMAYAAAVGVYLGFCVDKMTDTNTSLCSWQIDPPRLRSTFGRQALPMVWDFAEANVFGDAAGDFGRCVQSLTEVVERQTVFGSGKAEQLDAQKIVMPSPRVVSTDPPYYDNIGYADLSDFFYVWLRRSQREAFPDLFATVSVPKAEELVATPYRHGSRDKAEAFFLDGMTDAMHRLAEQSHPASAVTIYYAFKQSESESDSGVASTGWETFLAAVIRAGFAITGTWPMRSELATRNVGRDTNALASSIVIVCRPRPADAKTATRREFVAALKSELPNALRHLQAGNIAPVDLAQAAIGPGMSIYTDYSAVLGTEGKTLSVREALALVNETLDEALAEQEGDFDADSRFALTWFEQHGFGEGEFGVADVLARAKNTSVQGMADIGILKSSRSKVRLLRPNELQDQLDPDSETRVTAWEIVHQLVRALESGGEATAASLVAKLGTKAEVARELAYRLYTLCERKKRAMEALSYNALVQSWPEIVRIAQEGARASPTQADLL